MDMSEGIGAGVGGVTGVGGSVAAVSVCGSVSGLSAAGISSGLAALGGSMAGGLVVVGSTPLVVAGLGYGVVKVYKRLKWGYWR